MSPEERRLRYRCLRALGASSAEAQMFKDWSPKHYEQMLDRLAGWDDQQELNSAVADGAE